MVSYYADKFHGRKTASGVEYDSTLLTAAHKTLPMGTIILVKNPKNGKNVLVEVNDRGPYSKDRLLDVSLEAAKILGIVSKGVALLEIEIIG